MKMDSNIEILRGWPGEMALERSETIKAAALLKNGDWVAKQADGTVALSGAGASNTVGVVIRGNADSQSASNVNKAIVLWGIFIARIQNYDTGATYAPGDLLTVKAGKVTKGVLGTDPILGFVDEVIAGTAQNTASIIAIIK